MALSEKKIPISHALLWIFFSTLLISGSAFMGWLYFLHLKDRRLNDSQYQIVAIIQKTSQKESLKTMYLAELLGLSLDQPVNLYRFDSEEGEKKLKSSPLIKQASIKKIRPGTLFIDYRMRSPVAYLENYSNTAVDEEGYLFPFRPFFTPKNLPAFYLDLDKQLRWGDSLGNALNLNLAFNVLRSLEKLRLYHVQIKRIDVSQAFEDSFGKRQIVAVLETNDGTREKGHLNFLRLNPDHFHQNLVNYETLCRNNKTSGIKVIDLRISRLAFIKEVETSDFEDNLKNKVRGKT
jgi:hypothetical protein